MSDEEVNCHCKWYQIHSQKLVFDSKWPGLYVVWWTPSHTSKQVTSQYHVQFWCDHECHKTSFMNNCKIKMYLMHYVNSTGKIGWHSYAARTDKISGISTSISIACSATGIEYVLGTFTSNTKSRFSCPSFSHLAVMYQYCSSFSVLFSNNVNY